MWGTYLVIFILLVHSSYAYIDPGTGGIIIGSFWQTIVAVLGAVIAFLIINPVKNIIKRLKNSKK
ncbi:TPA: hypothetical protein HA239_02040 [Candidatus Woesearchaeota archaeon]|nr:hypothetical protein QT06_C0001G1010 [archaeon GW2011_AR15]MBS3104516.1 hypothetical protein [Candidatus Woesearchaeota archaeon]HIH41170.1 hypothetical protein [Candidatus Woesearchaeota archaeon]